MTLLGCAASPASSERESSTRISSGAQLFEGMGDFHRPVTTSSEEAQAYLDQGMIWAQAFNYDEAIRSFEAAARLDPRCAMAWWGVSYCEGPSYNHPVMDEARQQASWDALQKAVARIDDTTALERGLIEAMARRYESPFPEDRKHLDEAYAEAMGELWQSHPTDAYVGMLYAESMMILKPWKLYNLEREPVEGTEKIVSVLQRVLEIEPHLPGACHLLIHAVEQGETPELALPAADRLSKLVPGSGHLLHMPSHIYIRTNLWSRSIEQNARAMDADVRYRQRSPEQFVQYLYQVHNNHIRAYSCMMVGREQEALAASRRMWTDIPAELLEDLGPLIDRWMCSVYDVQKRFGRWDDLLAEPAPPAHMPVTSAYWRAHRAVAYAAKKDFNSAQREFEAYQQIQDNLPADRLAPGRTVEAVEERLEVIRHFVPGEIALQRGDLGLAIEHLEKSVAAEDKLGFSGEPPDYLQPIRHTLGAVYLKAGKAAEAEQAFREDLQEYPGNGWSLYGLSRALQEQGKAVEAGQVEEQLRQAWAAADEPLSTSCRCIPRI